MDNIPLNKDISVITQYSEFIPAGTTTPSHTVVSYYHIPFFVWIVLATIIFFIAKRLIVEFLIRWRQ